MYGSMVQIVERRQRDIIPLRELFLKVRQNAFSWTDTDSFKLLDFDKETEGEYILVAISDNQLVGFISVWLADNFIHHLFIDEKHQRKGTGTKLLKAAIEKIGFPARLKCLENNTSAVDFYQKKGFAAKGKGQSAEGTYILFELHKRAEQETTFSHRFWPPL
jgi:GNAT superfamily N-acetyltransferase